MFQTGFAEKVRTYVLCSIIFFLNRAFYEIMWKDSVQSDRTQMTFWRMRFAYCTSKATNTHLVCVILTAFPLQQWLLERAQYYVIHVRTLPVLFCVLFLITSVKTKVFIRAISTNYQTALLQASDFYLSCPWPSMV
jgi:hypothetical protein